MALARTAQIVAMTTIMLNAVFTSLPLPLDVFTMFGLWTDSRLICISFSDNQSQRAPFHAILGFMTEIAETASSMDDADIEAWWAEDADITGRLVAAIAVACAAVPALNARYDRDRRHFEPLPTVDLGIAIETEEGSWCRSLTYVCHAPFTEISAAPQCATHRGRLWFFSA